MGYWTACRYVFRDFAVCQCKEHNAAGWRTYKTMRFGFPTMGTFIGYSLRGRTIDAKDNAYS
jgi:hypothetical protein